MSDISAGEFTSPDRHFDTSENERMSIVTIVLSAIFIIGMPTTFWVSLLELANYVFSLGITVSTRLVIAGTLVALLGLIWGFIQFSARQRKSIEREIELSARSRRKELAS